MDTTNNQQLKIAMAFSGGGYRAASFSLGTLSYLKSLTTDDENQTTLLDHVVVLSTISGGTITGTRYTLGIKSGQSFETIYKSLYSFMKETDIVNESLDRLLSDEGWGDERIKSLINAFADVYDRRLFSKALFGTIMAPEPTIHLKHIAFNATEFCNALPFRFQWSEAVKSPSEGEPSRGIIGNYKFRVPEEAAKEVSMADILASSSCFPGGFEPINFPTDFIRSESPNLRKLSGQGDFPVGLMDGGIVDNQGIEPILLAEARMKKNRPAGAIGNELDLVILTDVASPYMESYKASVERPAKGWRKLTPALVLFLNSILLLASGFGIYWSLRSDNKLMAILATIVFTLACVLFVLGRFLKGLPLKFDVPPFFLKPLGKLLKLKFQVYETLISNRKTSVLKMMNDVFLKHVRRLNYDRVYDDDSWKNRRIMNAIYELRTGEKKIIEKIKNGTLPAYLMPSTELQEVAALAASMSTTLWFSPDELHKKNMLNTIIACGQFTTCFNLLEYIESIRKDRTNTTKAHEMILALESKLKSDWNMFLKDPYWMVEEANQKLGLK